MIPVVMLYVSGIRIMVKNTGIASSSIFQLILVSGFIIKEPTSTRAMELAILGTIDSKGEKKIKGRNKSPAVIAVSPVLPPSRIPTADSIYAVPELVPTNPENIVVSASTKSDFLRFFGFPSASLSIE